MGCGRGGDFNAEISFKSIDEDGILGSFAHGRPARSGHQITEWARGEGLRFLLSYTAQHCCDSWFRPKSIRGRPIDCLLCRERGHCFSGAAKVLSEDPLGTS